MMLKGWKMLNEQCPVSGLVPLMEHPTTGRKYTVVAQKYLDEIKPGGSGNGGGAEVDVSDEKVVEETKPSPQQRPPVPKPPWQQREASAAASETTTTVPTVFAMAPEAASSDNDEPEWLRSAGGAVSGPASCGTSGSALPALSTSTSSPSSGSIHTISWVSPIGGGSVA